MGFVLGVVGVGLQTPVKSAHAEGAEGDTTGATAFGVKSGFL